MWELCVLMLSLYVSCYICICILFVSTCMKRWHTRMRSSWLQNKNHKPKTMNGAWMLMSQWCPWLYAMFAWSEFSEMYKKHYGSGHSLSERKLHHHGRVNCSRLASKRTMARKKSRCSSTAYSCRLGAASAIFLTATSDAVAVASQLPI